MNSFEKFLDKKLGVSKYILQVDADLNVSSIYSDVRKLRPGSLTSLKEEGKIPVFPPFLILFVFILILIFLP